MNYISTVRSVLPLKIFTHVTIHKIVFAIGFGSPGGLKLGSALYF